MQFTKEAVIKENVESQVDLLKISDSRSYSYSFYNGQLKDRKRLLLFLICPFSPSALHGDGGAPHPFFTSKLSSFYDKCVFTLHLIIINSKETHILCKKEPPSFK